MGIRIDIKWNFVSPSLQIAKGVVTVRYLKQPPITTDEHNTILIQCNCKIAQGSKGYSAIKDSKGVPLKLFDVFREQIDIMMESFFRGMLIKDSDFHWIDETLLAEFNPDEWTEQRMQEIQTLKEKRGERY